MAYVDLSQDPAALQRVFESAGLARPGEPVRATPLAGGVSSAIFRVDLDSGSYCVKQALPQLKVAKEWKVPVERVFAEIGYLRTVASIVPGHVPRVLGHDDGAKCFIMEFLGDDHRNWKADLLAGRVEVAVARDVGDIVGRVHSATADDKALKLEFANDVNFYAIRLEPYLVEASRIHADAADALHAAVGRTATTRRVLVHGDVSPKNILVGPRGPVLLDAECAWFGDPAFDVAFCLNHFLLKAAHMPQHMDALMACLGSFVSAYAAHVLWEPWSNLETRIALLLPGLTLARVDGKSPVEYLDESGRGLVREAALGLLREGPQELETIAQDWTRRFAR